jgi:oxygen-independent coproporphyrinogen-3 oxidase
VSALEVPLELLRRYNVPGPRYTSYPTAPMWKDSLGAADYASILEESSALERPAPLSLYFHLPFCEKLCFFCGCTVVITGSRHVREETYIDVVEKEMDWVAAALGGGRERPGGGRARRVGRDSPRKVVQLHWGGGTPTYFAPELLERLGRAIRNRFDVAADAELGVEVDPRVTTREHLETLAGLGFNRLSMGVQDFDPRVQAAINRIQPFEATRDLVREARRLGFPSINLDLIYGLPHQTPESFDATIDRVLEMDPDRLAVYSYANVPWMKKHQTVLEPHLPEEATKFEIFRTALERFSGAGYEYIGMDHFARPTDELARARRERTLHRNFQGYTTKAGTDLLGFGMSAIGSIGRRYVQNRRELADYREAVASGGSATFRGIRLTDDDVLRREVIQSLLCHGVVVRQEIEARFGIRFEAEFGPALEALAPCVADGLVTVDSREIRATALGRIFLRNLAMPFDAYLGSPAEKPVFSRTL